MNRFGTAHKAIVECMLDGKARSRADLEVVVFKAMRDKNPLKHNPPVWRSATTHSLKWLVSNSWLSVRRDRDCEIFVINKTKRKFYLNVKRAQELDRELGRLDEKGRYRRGSKREESRPGFRVLGRGIPNAPWLERNKKPAKRVVGPDIEDAGSK